MRVKRFINSIFESNSYLIYYEKSDSVYVIDPGDSIPIIEFIVNNNKILKGILITHYHFDHIYGVNELRKKFKNSLVYASLKSKDGLFSSKINGSLYAEMPLIIENKDVIWVKNGDLIELCNTTYANVYDTPGHNDDCISYHIGNYLFVGDTLIPGFKVHLRSKKADKDEAYKSISWIEQHFSGETIICPGHKEEGILKEITIIL